jgi:carbonic anhydrase
MRHASAAGGLLLVASTLFTAGCASMPAPQTVECPPQTADRRTPEDLWAELVKGNGVFVGGDVHYTGLVDLREKTAKQQTPPVSILSCADSRVMPEVTFERTINQLFVARVAGNVAPKNQSELASLEFAVLNGWTTLIVVMGHSDCGAIKAALATNDPPTPALRALVAQIRPALRGIPRTDNPTAEQLRRATDANTRYVANQLTKDSALLAKCVATRQVTIYTAYYDGATGRAERLP